MGIVNYINWAVPRIGFVLWTSYAKRKNWLKDWGKVYWRDKLIQARNGYGMLWVNNKALEDAKGTTKLTIFSIIHFPLCFSSFFVFSCFVLFLPFSLSFLPLLIDQGGSWTIAWIICWTNRSPCWSSPDAYIFGWRLFGGTTSSQSSRGVGECCDEARDGGATTMP